MSLATKKQPRKLKIIQLRIICKDQFGIKTTRLIDEQTIIKLESEFQKSGGTLTGLLLNDEISYESNIQLLN